VRATAVEGKFRNKIARVEKYIQFVDLGGGEISCIEGVSGLFEEAATGGGAEDAS
jgi:hypothetical protein